ncbi:hypothetical protein NL676_010496 [Syzygium grande]|nr:hypothetical protein NL676_010496 [Syzygium grande]
MRGQLRDGGTREIAAQISKAGRIKRLHKNKLRRRRRRRRRRRNLQIGRGELAGADEDDELAREGGESESWILISCWTDEEGGRYTWRQEMAPSPSFPIVAPRVYYIPSSLASGLKIQERALGGILGPARPDRAALWARLGAG